MASDYYSTKPSPDSYLQMAKAKRAAMFYAAAKAVARALSASTRGIVDRLRRLVAEHQTYRKLSALSDHRLQDIGIDRNEIASVARGVTVRAADFDATIAKSRRGPVLSSGGTQADVFDFPRCDESQRRLAAPIVAEPAVTAEKKNDAAA